MKTDFAPHATLTPSTSALRLVRPAFWGSVAIGLVTAAFGCQRAPMTSSSTNWVSCSDDTDCAAVAGAVCGEDRFCVDGDGAPIPGSEFAESSGGAGQGGANQQGGSAPTQEQGGSASVGAGAGGETDSGGSGGSSLVVGGSGGASIGGSGGEPAASAGTGGVRPDGVDTVDGGGVDPTAAGGGTSSPDLPGSVVGALGDCGIEPVGEPTVQEIDIPEELSGPNWGLKNDTCELGGWTLSDCAGSTATFTTFPTDIEESGMPESRLDAWVVTLNDEVCCVYLTGNSLPGVYNATCE